MALAVSEKLMLIRLLTNLVLMVLRSEAKIGEGLVKKREKKRKNENITRRIFQISTK